MNDLVTRAHVSEMFAEADARQEYHDYLDGIADDMPENDFNVECPPAVESVECQLNAQICRQTAIAASKGMSLDDYREDLADRRDLLLQRIHHERWLKRMADSAD